MHWGQIYVCNPTSQQQLKLPDPPCVSFKSGAHVGFGYVPSKNVYKVVDFFSAEPKSGKGCMVFTLHDGGGNSGAWRVIADCPNIPTGSWCSRFACVNGTLYWRVLRQSYGGTRPNIAAFDLGEEKFRMIQYPQGHLDDYGGDMDYLIELEGFLCLVKSFRCKIMDIWMLKDQVWVKEYSIDFSSLGAISVLCHTPLDVRDGEILFKESQGDLLHYNIQSESFRRTTRLFCNGRFGSPFLYFDNLFSLGSS
ncbi:hypothetical protein L1049_003840 [Liquidambar formosana]|uniref:F-box associated beta-propeller type 3 domain-containing protein n=1 Tax=Liquidambar formosana TaxID=63359 RepID=A0AAP0RMI6_LIQFO